MTPKKDKKMKIHKRKHQQGLWVVCGRFELNVSRFWCYVTCKNCLKKK